jgi:hypothetical protein
MIKKRVNKINWHGSDLENNRAKAPNISTPGGNGLDGLNDGEIYVCNADEDPAIFIKTNKDKVARVGGNGSDSYSRDQIDDFLGKKLDKVVWDRNLEERVDDNGEEYLFLTKPLITAYGVTMYAGADVQVPSIYEGLPIDGVTIQWVDGKLVATGGKGTANGIVVNGNTYTPNDDGIITLPNYPTSLEWDNISGKPSWIGATKPTYDFSEIQNKPTTIAGYGITDAYTKNDISGLLVDYVTKSGAQDITGIKSFINGLNIGDILVKKHSDGVVELDGDLILTGSLTMFAQGSHTASTILDALPIDNTTLSKEGGVLSVIGGVGGGSVDGIILNETTYSPDETTKLITLPNYPTTLPASDVYSWAKQPNKPSYSFGELSSHPTTLGGYGITDAYTKTDADSRYFRHIGDTYEDGRNTGWIGFGTGTYIEAYPDGIAHKIYSYGQVTSFNSSYSRLELYSTHTSSDPNDGNNGIQFRSGWNDDKKSWRMLLDEVNYLHYTDNRYVNKAGDTMTGKLLFNANSSIDLVYIPRTKSAISFNNAGSNRIGINFTDGDGNLRIAKTDINQDWVSGDVNILLGSNNYKVIHTGNKRDMFSSMNEAFTAWGNEQVINVEGDANTYYPVVITIDGTKTWNSRISIYKNLGSRTPSYPGNHSNGTSSMWAMYEGRYYGWDGNSGYIVTKYVRQPYANLISKAEHAGNSAGKLVVYLRGGGCEYRVCTDYRAGVSVYYERTEISGDSNYPVYVEPTTSVGNQGVLNMVSYDYLVQKAVRLETPRSLWGQTFDGTGNVNGTIMFDYISGGNERDLLYQQMADNDLFRIRCGGSSNQGWVEIATADDGTEPIYVRQYTGEFASVTRTLTLLDGSGNTICPGNLLTNGGITMYSDLRKKNVLNSIIVPLDVMANADLFDYTFKTDEKCKVRAGTSAQYWNVFLPQVTDTDNEGFFTMSYDVLATTCVLSIAKHFQRFLIEDFNNHETRIEFLERENKELKDSNKEMMNRIIELERRAA